MICLNRLENSAASYFAETQVCKVGQGPCQGQAKAKAFKSGFHQIPTFSLVIGERLESFIDRNELRLGEKTCGLEMFKISFFRLDCNYSSSSSSKLPKLKSLPVLPCLKKGDTRKEFDFKKGSRVIAGQLVQVK